MTALARALSRMPRISRPVMIGGDQRRGQVEGHHEVADVGRAAPAISGVPAAVCRSVAIQAGKSTPEGPAQEGTEIVRPALGDVDVADRVFDDQIPADDPGEDLAQGHVGVGVGAARHRDHGGDLRVAEGREATGHRGDQVRQRSAPAPRPADRRLPAAICPVLEKMPAPTMAPMPSMARSVAPSVRRSPWLAPSMSDSAWSAGLPAQQLSGERTAHGAPLAGSISDGRRARPGAAWSDGVRRSR